MTFDELLKEYNDLLEQQPEAVKTTLTSLSAYMDDDIRTVLDCLLEKDDQITTYSHS